MASPISNHSTTKLHEFTENLLSDGKPENMLEIANEIKAPLGDQVDFIKLYATRDRKFDELNN